jgi:LDH2 family malate/lactate/ureidoglycolate dehydrogenase
MRVVSKSDLDDFSKALLRAVGVPAKTAGQVVDALIAADCGGVASHGLALLPMYLDRIKAGSVNPRASGRVVSKNGGAIVVDAQNCLGQISSYRAVEMAVESCSVQAISAIAVRNGFHIGALGYWARRIARANCIGIIICNTRPLLPPPGGATAVVGNNPIAIALPAVGEDLVLDIALSAGAMGKVRLAASEGKSIPEGWATDSKGRSTTNPHEAISGMLLPAGGPKGFGLAFMIDLIAGGLSTGAIGRQVSALYGDSSVPYRSSHFFMAIKVASFTNLDLFKKAAADLAEQVRSTASANGNSVRMFGDRSQEMRRQYTDRVPLSEATISNLSKSAHALGVASPLDLMP